jgi:hypothetical protein
VLLFCSVVSDAVVVCFEFCGDCCAKALPKDSAIKVAKNKFFIIFNFKVNNLILHSL